MLSEAVHNPAHVNFDPVRRDIIAEDRCTIRGREHGLGQILAHLSFIDIKGCHHSNILGLVTTQIIVHQADMFLAFFVAVIFNALNK